MSNIEFLNATTNSYWIRDFGPWYIFNGKEPAIVDNKYNRPRPYDDDLPGHFAEYWGIEMFGMNVIDVASLDAGRYFVRISDDKGNVSVKKVVKN